MYTLLIKKMYYCYILYVADYDYGGHMDTRATVFPILYEIFSEKEDADEWLIRNEKNKNKDFSSYDLLIYSVEVSKKLLFPELL